MSNQNDDLLSLPHIITCISGPSKSGKSTLAGRLLFNNKSMTEKDEKVFNNLSEKNFRLIVEHEKRDAIDADQGISCNIKLLKGDRRRYTIIDSPSKYPLNEIRSGFMASVQILVIGADTEIKKDAEYALMEEIREFLLYHRIYDPQVLILISKMDKTNPPYSEEIFNNLSEIISKSLISARYKDRFCPIIPISSTEDYNITSSSTRISWWSGIDHPGKKYWDVMDLLENFVKLPKRSIYAETRAVVYKEYPKQQISCSQILQGTIKEGDMVYIPIIGKETVVESSTITSIRVHQCPIEKVSAGEHCVGMSIENQLPKRGTLFLSKHDLILQSPQEKVIAEIMVFHGRNSIKIGAYAVVAVHSISLLMQLSSFLWSRRKIKPEENTKDIKQEENPKDKTRGEYQRLQTRGES